MLIITLFFLILGLPLSSLAHDKPMNCKLAEVGVSRQYKEEAVYPSIPGFKRKVVSPIWVECEKVGSDGEYTAFAKVKVKHKVATGYEPEYEYMTECTLVVKFTVKVSGWGLDKIEYVECVDDLET
jgi:hypothetical protein